MRRAIAVLVLVLALGAALLPAANAGSGNTFYIRNNGIYPGDQWAHMVVTKGTTVTWRNKDSRAHRLASYSSNWSWSVKIPAGGSVSRTFNSTGLFRWRDLDKTRLYNGYCYGGSFCGYVRVK